MAQNEYYDQCALFQYAELLARKNPEWGLLHASANGGKRNIVTAYRLKKSGVKAGIPDIFLPVARGKYHGLFIEMKSENGVVSSEQKKWISALTDQGYLVEVCRGWEKAKYVIESYLSFSL